MEFKEKMKYILLAFIAIAMVLCQPAFNPSGTGACAATYTCVPTGSTCGNITGPDSKNIADQVQTSVIMPLVAIVLQDIQLDIHATQLYILPKIQIAHLSIA